MALSEHQLRRELSEAGIANAAIDAVWPDWWSDEAAQSPSATAELTYTVARRLGLSPKTLFDGSAQFLWRDDTKFKNLGTASEREQEIIAAFGVAVGRSAVRATKVGPRSNLPDAVTLRETILAQNRLVDAAELLNFCWAFGIPVIQLRLFPLRQKRMHAMTIKSDGRYAILLGFETRYWARIAYIIAHEVAHILLGHLADSGSLLEIDDPLDLQDPDEEEAQADALALTLLTGSPNVQVTANVSSYTATQLADAAMRQAPGSRIEPGILALCLGHSTDKWRQSFGALKIIPPGEAQVADQINELAAMQFDWQALSYDSQEYLSRVIGRWE
jgi:hypothetical protein